VDTEHAIATLRRYETALRARGVRHAAVFGSVARRQNRSDSDVDILIDIDPGRRMTVFDYVGLKEFVASLFDGQVDVISRKGLKSHVRPAVMADEVDVF
jgi:uncharacterized protein